MLLLRLFTPEEELPWPESLPSRGSQRAERNEALRRLIVEGRLPPVPQLEGLSREPERRERVQLLMRDCTKAESARPTFKEICERWEQIRAIQEQVPPSTVTDRDPEPAQDGLGEVELTVSSLGVAIPVSSYTAITLLPRCYS